MKGVNKENIKKHALNEFLSEYKELNTDNKYRPVAVGRYGIRKRESIYSKELAKDYSKNKLIHKDTLTVGMGSKQIDIGILIEDETFAVSPAYHTYKIQGIRCKYLEYCLQSKNIEMFSLYAKRGSRQGKSIDLKRWLTYKIPVYSEEDQIVIEENLNKINVVIELRRKQLELLDELVRARFVEMFSDNHYELIRLADVCTKITDGTHKTPNYLSEGITFISAKNIVKNKLDFSDVKYISEDEYQEIQKRCQTEFNDILLSKSGSLGTPVIVKTDKKLGLFESLAVLKYDRLKLVPEFLCEQLKNEEIQRQFKVGVKGVAIKHLHLGVIGNVKIIVPPLELQNQFASFVEEIDKSRLRELLAIKQIKLLLHDSWFLFY